MNNPWTKLEASRNGYVLDEDLDAVNEFNRSVSDTKARIVFDALPEPYIGNPDLAKVVFLGLNPGYSVTDPESFFGSALSGVSRLFLGQVIKERGLAGRNRQIPGANDCHSGVLGEPSQILII
jgi:hypothetical protein